VKKLYWLASYPKSGNTWFRVVLANYLGAGARPADINRLRGIQIASDRDAFDRWAGVESSDLPVDEIANLRPDVFRQMALHAGHPVYIKVHDACIRNSEGQLLFPPDVTGSVLYMIRNPLDVAVSYAHHAGCTMQAAVDTLCEPEGSPREIPVGMPAHLPQRLRSWSDHVRSWVQESGMRVTVIRFEDMLSQPEVAFSAGLRAIDLDIEAPRLTAAIAFSRFELMQAQEQQAGFDEKHVRADAPFFRRGRAGAWRDELAPQLAEKILSTQAQVMAQYGYLDANHKPVF
jgi:aryl sulfotransferase